MLCKECVKRATCAQLCPAAERYVNQDFISHREERPFSDYELELLSESVGLRWEDIANYHHEFRVNFPCLTKLDNKILHLKFFEGLTYAQISEELGAIAVNKGYGRRVNEIRHQYQRIICKLRAFFRNSGGNLYEKD